MFGSPRQFTFQEGIGDQPEFTFVGQDGGARQVRSENTALAITQQYMQPGAIYSQRYPFLGGREGRQEGRRPGRRAGKRGGFGLFCWVALGAAAMAAWNSSGR